MCWRWGIVCIAKVSADLTPAVAEALVPYRKSISLVDRRHLALMEASRVPRWPVETMLVGGKFSLSRR